MDERVEKCHIHWPPTPARRPSASKRSSDGFLDDIISVTDTYHPTTSLHHPMSPPSKQPEQRTEEKPVAVDASKVEEKEEAPVEMSIEEGGSWRGRGGWMNLPLTL